MGLSKLYDRKLPITAADLLNDRVVPFFDAHDIKLCRMLSLWLLNAFALALTTPLGATGEALGYDWHLKPNTTKRRTHSVFRQGCVLYELIPTMPKHRLLPLVERYAAMLAKLPVSADILRHI